MENRRRRGGGGVKVHDGTLTCNQAGRQAGVVAELQLGGRMIKGSHPPPLALSHREKATAAICMNCYT